MCSFTCACKPPYSSSLPPIVPHFPSPSQELLPLNPLHMGACSSALSLYSLESKLAPVHLMTAVWLPAIFVMPTAVSTEAHQNQTPVHACCGLC